VTVAVRPAAVAGTFYTADPVELRRSVEAMLEAAPASEGPVVPKALIAPHAGHVYSGPVAATAYRAAAGHGDRISRVVLFGPAHRHPVRGIAVPRADAFDTPLGAVPVDGAGREALTSLTGVEVSDAPHTLEHSLEVHLPFLQVAFGDVSLVPALVGAAHPADVAAAFDAVWGGEETLVVASSDLSHYYDAATARRLDRRTADVIVAGAIDELGPEDACGAGPVRGLLLAAERRGLRCSLLDLRTSADTAGPADRVVGYGAFSFA
jgi:AmmeMemoRadiSam system protein B